MRTSLTPKQVAVAIGVSEASVKRWCDLGILPSVRTAGGHRRLSLPGVLKFLRDTGRPVARPELLGLPSSSGEGPLLLRRVSRRMAEALSAGDEEVFRGLAFNLFLARHSAAAICDQAIAPAFHELGTQWQHGRLEVYQERRGVEIALRVLHNLAAALPPLALGAPLAIGGTLAGDPYILPNAMVELALRDAGWRAESCGTGLPAASLAAAVRARGPRLCWLSVSAAADATSLADDVQTILEVAGEVGALLVAGGRALTSGLRADLPGVLPVDSLSRLSVLAGGLAPEATAARLADAPGPASAPGS